MCRNIRQRDAKVICHEHKHMHNPFNEFSWSTWLGWYPKGHQRKLTKLLEWHYFKFTIEC